MRLKKLLIPLLICILGCMFFVAGCGESKSKKEPESKTVTVTDCTDRSVELQPLRSSCFNSQLAEAIRI